MFENPAFQKQTKKIDEPDALGHDLIFVEAKEPSDTEDGNIAYYFCRRCGKFFEDAEGKVEIEDHDSVIIPALNPVPETGDNDITVVLAVSMMAVSVTASGLYLSMERQKRKSIRKTNRRDPVF